MTYHIHTALAAYGITAATLLTLPNGRVAVYVDGEYFGVWDVERRTFVD